MAGSAKKPVAKGGLGGAALEIALSVLRSDAVREQLKRAPEALMDWAIERRPHPSSGQFRAAVQRINPAARLGQRGLERRLENLTSAVSLAFGEKNNTSRPEVWEALDDLAQSVAIAGSMPTIKRKRMHMRIDDELDKLEMGLIEALLPKH